MASFTDIIPKFNPYIQQLPVEAMVKVGMEKQKRYDEGLQKIQSQIENVAGLDVVRDIDKQYLQSKLGELGNNLKSFAASDFSNFQLVNTVSGMTGQIVKDKNVINAVQSTSWYRKQLAEMEKAISEGKSSVENIYDFNEKANRWLSSKNLDQSFRDRYTPYVDIKKKAMETIKALHPKLKQYDVPFEINPDGSINTKKIADAMKRYKIEGVDENQIAQALTAAMTPDDLNQMSISAKYQFRDVSPEQLVERATTIYASQKRDATESLAKLFEQRNLASDPNLVKKLDEEIDYYEKLLGKDGVPGLLDEKLKENVEMATNNPDAVKTSLYKSGFVKEFANAFGWKNVTETYETNPIRQQLNWAADFKFKQQQEQNRQQEFKLNYGLKLEEQRLKAEENALKRAELYGDPTANEWMPLGNATDDKLMGVEYFNNNMNEVSSTIEGDISRLSTRYSKGEIDTMLADWEKNGPNGKLVKPDAIGLLENISRNNAYLKSLRLKEEQIKAKAEQDARKNPEISKKMNEANAELTTLSKTTKPLSLNVNGKIVKITAAQLAQDIKNGKASLRVDTAPLGKINLKYNVDGRIVNIEMSKSAIGVDKVGAAEARPLLLGLGGYLKKNEDALSKYEKLKNDIYKDEISKVAQQTVPELKVVATGKNGEPPPAVLTNLSRLITRAEFMKIAADENFDIEKASKMLLEENKKDTRVFIEQAGNTYRVHIKSDSDPSNRQILKLSKSDVVKYFGAGYVKNNVEESIRLAIGNGNTNITGLPEDAMFQKKFGDFPGVQKLQVTADLESDLADPDLYTAMINVKRKDGRYTNFQISGKDKLRRLGFDQGKKSFNMLTDNSLLTLLKENYPDYDFSNLEY